jgi:hypothetical protein
MAVLQQRWLFGGGPKIVHYIGGFRVEDPSIEEKKRQRYSACPLTEFPAPMECLFSETVEFAPIDAFPPLRTLNHIDWVAQHWRTLRKQRYNSICWNHSTLCYNNEQVFGAPNDNETHTQEADTRNPIKL